MGKQRLQLTQVLEHEQKHQIQSPDLRIRSSNPLSILTIKVRVAHASSIVWDLGIFHLLLSQINTDDMHMRHRDGNGLEDFMHEVQIFQKGVELTLLRLMFAALLYNVSEG